MPLDPYRLVLRRRAARRVLLLGLFTRLPVMALPIALTLHVVSTLHRSYSEAGLVAAASTVCVGISAPWRGRLIDRVGLRRTIAPAIALQLLGWLSAPFVSYWPLVAIVGVSSLYSVPAFSVIRQALIAAVPDDQRRSALALDSSAVEVSFMVGPLLGVWAATALPTREALLILGLADVAAACGLWLADPAVRRDTAPVHGRAGGWVSRGFLALCAAGAATTIVLNGTDLATVAVLRHLGAGSVIGLAMSVWGLGSFCGGVVYGALHRPISAYWLLGGLAAGTAPLAFAPGAATVIPLIFVAGLFCAPTITASMDQVSALVPDSARGEAFGWHGSAMTIGSALGGPLTGLAIDRVGGSSGYLAVAVLGALVAVAGYAATPAPAPALVAVD